LTKLGATTFDVVCRSAPGHSIAAIAVRIHWGCWFGWRRLISFKPFRGLQRPRKLGIGQYQSAVVVDPEIIDRELRKSFAHPPFLLMFEPVSSFY